MTAADPHGPAFAELRFEGRAQSVQALLKAVLARTPQKQAVRILDLGCGVGDLCLGLAAALPEAVVVGLDISAENIAAAKSRPQAGGGSEVCFVEADYTLWEMGKFDILTADSVLQWIPVDTKRLASKIARDLTPGGLLIAAVPAVCATNDLLLAKRRIWRRLPRVIDKAALALARLVYPKEAPAVLADRITYLRLVPHLLHGPKLVETMRKAGLELVEDIDWPGASSFKLRHRLVVYRNAPTRT